MRALVVIGAMVLAGPAIAKEPIAPPASAPPDYANARAMAEQSIKTSLIDPASALFVYTSGFQWGYAKPVFGGRTWGWIACGTVNAKNRLGGYVGADRFWILSDANGNITWNYVKETISTCDGGQNAPLQTVLTDRPTQSSGGGTIGIAEELGKLADLRDKGVITAAEFEAQKAKLLSR